MTLCRFPAGGERMLIMRILFSDITTLDENGVSKMNQYVLVDGIKIASITDKKPEGTFDRVISGKGKLLMPGLYNTHAHSAMTLFRGYGEDMPLQKWLFDCIFPAEELLTDRSVYDGSLLACAEMLRGGTVSFSDMYFFCNQTAQAAADIGMKANISRCCQSFDPDVTAEKDERFKESIELHKNWHNACEGRIKIDMALHAEYTIQPQLCDYVAAYARDNDLCLQVHMSETEREHKECMERRNGRTPARFLYDHGVFDARTVAAHCVWVTDEDIAIMKEKNVTPAHNPVSNLKLGSGVMPLLKMHRAGLNITLGTDGAASNNRLDILREVNLAALLQKGTDRVCDAMCAADFIPMVTCNGAYAQNRPDCGRLKEGYRADLILLDMDALNNIPSYEPVSAVLYASDSRNVTMTMVDGKVLYENGTFTTIDIEAVKYRLRDTVSHYFDRK